jgi:nicotinamide-nucleotide amidase
MISMRLGAGPDSVSWFGGGVVAYQEEIKFGLLGVEEGPVVTESCAVQLAQGALRLFNADMAVSATGVGGPEPREGKPPGTVFICVATDQDSVTRELALQGDPELVLEQTCAAAVALVAEVLDA